MSVIQRGALKSHCLWHWDQKGIETLIADALGQKLYSYIFPLFFHKKTATACPNTCHFNCLTVIFGPFGGRKRLEVVIAFFRHRSSDLNFKLGIKHMCHLFVIKFRFIKKIFQKKNFVSSKNFFSKFFSKFFFFWKNEIFFLKYFFNKSKFYNELKKKSKKFFLTFF